MGLFFMDFGSLEERSRKERLWFPIQIIESQLYLLVGKISNLLAYVLSCTAL